MFFFLSKILDIMLAPLTWAIVLVAVGLGWRRAPGRRRWFAVAGLAVLLLFSFEPFANALERSMERDAPRTFRPGITYDAVILLGGVVERSSVPARPSYNHDVERLLVTYDLLRTGHARFAILSGGRLDPSVPNLIEAGVLGQQLVDWGIAPDRVVLEPNSRNTRENAVESERIVRSRGWTKVLVVTSAFHMMRALGCFRAVGLAVDTLPVDYRAYDPARFSGEWLPRAVYLERSTGAVREWFGRLIYRVRGFSR